MTGPQPQNARLYFGHVMHARTRPAQHRFRYGVFSLLLDIDSLDMLGRASALFSVDRFNLFSFHTRDHGPRDGTPLRAHITRLLAQSGVDMAGDTAEDKAEDTVGPIKLLCYPRILGYVFNPLSIYYCYRQSGELAALVYQVHNTFGDTHSYVAPVAADETDGRVIRQARDKHLHVSPFVGMAATYRFTLTDPAQQIAVHIREEDEDGPFLLATFDGTARPFSTRSLVAAFFRYPLMTFKVMGAIHFEALRLWLKGVPYFARPAPPPEPASASGPATGPHANAIDPAKGDPTKGPKLGYSDTGVTKTA